MREVATRIERFEDLIAWQKARQLRLAIREVTLGTGFARDPDLRSQRAATQAGT